MTDYLDPFDYIETEKISEGLKAAIQQPDSFNYRSNDSDRFTFPSEKQFVNSATVDFANNNVEIQYDAQETEEKYVVVVTQARIGLVESHTNMPSEGTTETVVRYHLITPEADMVYDGRGYTESSNDLPRDAAFLAPLLIDEAEEFEDLEETGSVLEPSSDPHESKTVPPPPEDPLFED